MRGSVSVMTKFAGIGLLLFSAGCAAPAPVPEEAPDIDVVELTAEQIQADYAEGRYTAVQLTNAFLARIDRHEDLYNAFISMNPDALATAAALDAEYASTGPRGPLHGVPVVVKDNIDQAGQVTTAGYDGFSAATGGVDMIPDDDAAVVTRLREAGAVILGKTNLPDFAGHGTRTESSVAGVTLNAYDVNRVPGGSSGGTATAVNASFAVLGLGTETGGSIQNPSAAQALVGVKPTYGLVPLEGVVPLNGSYADVVGPMAKTVRDAAVALDALAGPTPEDLATYAASGNMPEDGYAAALDPSALAGRRFGLVGEGWRDTWLPLAEETEAMYRGGHRGAAPPRGRAGGGSVRGHRLRGAVRRAPARALRRLLRHAQLLPRARPRGGVPQRGGVGGAVGQAIPRPRGQRAPTPGTPQRHRGGRRLPGLAGGHPRAVPQCARGQRSRRSLLPSGRRAHRRSRGGSGASRL